MNESWSKPGSPSGGSVPRGEKKEHSDSAQAPACHNTCITKAAGSTSAGKTEPIREKKTSMSFHMAKPSPKFKAFSVFSHMLIYSLMTALVFPSSPA